MMGCQIHVHVCDYLSLILACYRVWLQGWKVWRGGRHIMYAHVHIYTNCDRMSAQTQTHALYLFLSLFFLHPPPHPTFPLSHTHARTLIFTRDMQSLKTKLKDMHQEIPKIFCTLQNTTNSLYMQSKTDTRTGIVSNMTCTCTCRHIQFIHTVSYP